MSCFYQGAQLILIVVETKLHRFRATASRVMVDSILVYLGFALGLVGLLSLIHPIRFLYLRTRSSAAIIAAFGMFIVIVALLLPVPTKRVTTPATRLDDWMPVWQFDERHLIHVDAPPEKVYGAIRTVRSREILFFRLLTAIRRCGQPGPESILDAPEEKPLLDVATQTTFLLLADERPRELVIGTIVAAPSNVSGSARLSPELFRHRLPPGVALAAMNFFVRPDENGGSIVSSETRVCASDSSGARRFAIYWRIIHPGSDLIRRMWLRAIKLRAEGTSSPS